MVTVIAEIGINHNGDINLAGELIHAAAEAGADYVKFQKRTVELCYSPMELSKIRETPFGSTNGDLKRHLELSPVDYDTIDLICEERKIGWTASCWDAPSITFMQYYQPDFLKIPSALITQHDLLRAYRDTGLPLVMSTGMSSLQEVEAAVGVLGSLPQLTLLACTSTYPCRLEDVNLRQIGLLQRHFGLPVGFSSHTVSPWPILGAVALGATIVEAHITLDRSMFGTDQAASLEPTAFKKMVTEVRDMEIALGESKKECLESEVPVREKLRYGHPNHLA